MDQDEQWMIQTAFLGDAVLSLPFVKRALEHSSSRWRLVVSPRNQKIFQLAMDRGLKAETSRLIVSPFDKKVDGGIFGMRRWLKNKNSPGRVFCLQRSFRSGFLAWMSGAAERVGFSSGSASFFYSRPVARLWDSGKSEVEKNLDLLRAVYDSVEAWSPSTAPSILSSGTASPGDYVALSLGSPWPTKRWPVENALQLGKILVKEGIPIKLIGDQAAQELSQEFCRQLPSLLVEDCCGKSSIEEWVGLIESSRLVISGDSAAVHIASDLKRPVIALFGPTLPEFGYAPWRKQSLALGVAELPCRPCHIHGPKKCPQGHHRCLKEIGGEDLYFHAKRFLLDPGIDAE